MAAPFSLCDFFMNAIQARRDNHRHANIDALAELCFNRLHIKGILPVLRCPGPNE